MAKKRVKTKTPPPPPPPLAKNRVRTTSKTLLAVDRFTKLPDPVIQHILSFLPTIDVVRTSLLSKRWRHMSHSVPTLCFSDSTIHYDSPRARRMFHKYVDNCLKCRKIGMCSTVDSVITGFKLEMLYNPSCNDRLDEWLAFVVESKCKLKELNLCLVSEDLDGAMFNYCLPETIVNSKYLTILELAGIELNSSYTFSLPSLKTLSLTEVIHDDNVVDMLLLGSSSLEKLLLSHCWELDFACFRSLSLKFLEIKKIDEKVVFQVEATNLESFVLVDVNGAKINLSACKAIRNLTLLDV